MDNANENALAALEGQLDIAINAAMDDATAEGRHMEAASLVAGVAAHLNRQAEALKKKASMAAAAQAKATALAKADSIGKRRPERTGKWFLVHDSIFSEIDHEEVCDIYTEFLKDHPNGREEAAEFTSIRLTDDQLEKYATRIRISSYRWEDVKGVGEDGKQSEIPGNYLRYLDYVRERSQILWMDWMANLGVNVPVAEVLDYMGLLYAEHTVLGEWMLDLDKLPVAMSRAWIFQEMAYGPLDKDAMGGLFEQLRTRGRALIDVPISGPSSTLHPMGIRRHTPADAEALQAYVDGCACVASLLIRRAFAVHGADCKWFQNIGADCDVYGSLMTLGFRRDAVAVAYHHAKYDLPNFDETVFCKILVLFWPLPVAALGWDNKWEAYRGELLNLVCCATYDPDTGSSNLGEEALVQRYAQGLLGAALGCRATCESDRPCAVTAVLQSIALKQFKVKRSAEQLIRMAWKCVLTEMTDAGLRGNFYVNNVQAPIVSGLDSFALAPLQLRGSEVTYSENTGRLLTCHYHSEHGQTTFNGNSWVVRAPVMGAKLKGVVCADTMQGIPERECTGLTKPQDQNGKEADICLCVPGATEFADFKGTFTLITQPGPTEVTMTKNQPPVQLTGSRLIAMTVLSKEGAAHRESGCDVKGFPPACDVLFYDRCGR